jgi:hypothetical protein
VSPAKASATANDGSTTKFLQNDRLKLYTHPDSPIDNYHKHLVFVSGVWLAESKDEKNGLAFPVQAKITCSHGWKQNLGTCEETTVSIVPASGMVQVGDLDSTTYDITRWDDDGLVANETDFCHLHILTIAFKVGAVAVSDIPTHDVGCEAFLATNSYRLARGHYWIDTTPDNDLDKPSVSPNK